MVVGDKVLVVDYPDSVGLTGKRGVVTEVPTGDEQYYTVRLRNQRLSKRISGDETLLFREDELEVYGHAADTVAS